MRFFCFKMNHAYDFSECYIDLGQIQPGHKATDVFPELRGLPEFKSSTHWYEFVVVACIADVQSPFRDIKDPSTKLDQIFDYWDLSKTNKKHMEFYESVLKFSDERIRNMICCYLKMLGSHIWTSYFGLYQTFYQLNGRLMKPLPPDDREAEKATTQKLAIQKQIDDIAQKLGNYESSLFGDDRLKKLLINQELTKIVSYPERHATQNSVI